MPSSSAGSTPSPGSSCSLRPHPHGAHQRHRLRLLAQQLHGRALLDRPALDRPARPQQEALVDGIRRVAGDHRPRHGRHHRRQGPGHRVGRDADPRRSLHRPRGRAPHRQRGDSHPPDPGPEALCHPLVLRGDDGVDAPHLRHGQLRASVFRPRRGRSGGDRPLHPRPRRPDDHAARLGDDVLLRTRHPQEAGLEPHLSLVGFWGLAFFYPLNGVHHFFTARSPCMRSTAPS